MLECMYEDYLDSNMPVREYVKLHRGEIVAAIQRADAAA